MTALIPEEPLRGEVFARTLLEWQAKAGRHTLPWQNTGDPYKVWLSEVMLQQTQVATVLAYFERFLQAFPTVRDLAAAPSEQVMGLWAGLGYYSRARNLHACAKAVVQHFGGEFPRAVNDLASLPGIGESTAGAVASLAYGERAAILDGNVKRVFCRYYGIEGYPEQTAVKRALWGVAHENVPAVEPGRYNQALMDLGATRCTPRKPQCEACPLMASCQALRQGKVGLLPEPKPKKARPVVQGVALVLRDSRGYALLNKRTEKGVWQDLWLPPILNGSFGGQADDARAVHAGFEALLEPLGLGLRALPSVQAIEQALQLPALQHELTHRRMVFHVVQHQVRHPLEPCVDPAGVALPKVVHKMLESTQGSVPNQDVINFSQGG